MEFHVNYNDKPNETSKLFEFFKSWEKIKPDLQSFEILQEFSKLTGLSNSNKGDKNNE